MKTAVSRQSSRNSSVSGPSKGSLPSSRTPSRPPSRPQSRPPSRPPSRPQTPPASRDPSPENEDSLSELPPKVEKKSRFSVIGIDANAQAQSKYGKSKERLNNPNKSAREKSPVVSFAEEVFDFEERQYQTVHAGCEIPKANNFRERTQSGRFIRNKRRNSQTQGRPSIIGWLMDKKRSTSTTISPKPISPLIKEDDAVSPDENENKEAGDKKTNPSLSPKARPRSKSDRFTRPNKKQVVEVYKQVSCVVKHSFRL